MIRPRLIDYHNVAITQAEVDFAIPFIDEDIPLYVDPFLMWKSPSQQDKALHLLIVNSFNNLGWLAQERKKDEAISQIIEASECSEVGLGHSAKRRGKRIGQTTAIEIIDLFERIPRYSKRGFTHFEEIQFFIEGISSDRISDIACNFLKSFLIDFTIEQCEKWGISLGDCTLPTLYDNSNYRFAAAVKVKLPVHPTSKAPILFVPKRWLRKVPWLNLEEYFKAYCPQDENANPSCEPLSRVQLLTFNRDNYGMIESYVEEKERKAEDCKNDPLFHQIPVISAKRKFSLLKDLPTGKDNNADKKYEEAAGQLVCSLFYTHLDFAAEQSRTESGVHIRDIIFYNNRSHPLLKDIHDTYDSKQIVMEMKNVKTIERDHINQLNRYLDNDYGRFGVLLTRNELVSPMKKNVVDLWSGKRRAIITLTDQDLEQMVELFDSKQRSPIDVLKKKYLEFQRSCPS